MVHTGNEWAIAYRDRIVSKAQSSPITVALKQDERLRILAFDLEVLASDRSDFVLHDMPILQGSRPGKKANRGLRARLAYKKGSTKQQGL